MPATAMVFMGEKKRHNTKASMPLAAIIRIDRKNRFMRSFSDLRALTAEQYTGTKNTCIVVSQGFSRDVGLVMLDECLLKN